MSDSILEGKYIEKLMRETPCYGKYLKGKCEAERDCNTCPIDFECKIITGVSIIVEGRPTPSRAPDILSNLLETAEEQKNKAYSERNRAVIMFAKIANRLGLQAGVRKVDDTEWGNVVYIDLPEGQVSWHIAPSEVHLLEGLPKYEGEWDGTYRKNDETFIKELKV